MIEFIKNQMRTRNMPYWKVWFRDITRASKSYNADVTQNYEDDIEDSIVVLENLINSTDTKMFTVQISDSPTVRFSSEGGNRFPLKKDPQSAHRISGNSSASLAGQNVDSYIAGQINQQMKIYDLEKKLEAIENAPPEDVTKYDKIIDTLHRLSEVPAIGQVIETISKIIAAKAIGPMAQGQVMMQGFSNEDTQEKKEEVITEQPNQEEQTLILTEALQRLQAHFPDIANMLTKLADAVDSNPDMMKGMINQFLKN